MQAEDLCFSILIRRLCGAVTKVQRISQTASWAGEIRSCLPIQAKVVYLSTQQNYLERQYRHYSKGHLVLKLFDSRRLQHQSQIPTL